MHNFGAVGDAASPYGALIFDKSGNAYGVSVRGGTTLDGTVFELSPSGAGWNETILDTFGVSSGDGQTPQGWLVMDSAGNLYGTTVLGGSRKLGTVYELSPASGGTWREKIIHNFIGGSDGRSPEAGLIFDKKGNLYGTTYQGGSGGTCGVFGCGVVFELSPKSSGAWSEKILHTFKGATTDGANSTASLAMDSAGNLYGTASSGGAHSNGGIAFKLTPNASGGWTETILHNFNSSSSDGYGPSANMVFDSAGNLYGTTTAGGTTFNGTVFKLTPGKSGNWTESVLHSFSGKPDGQAPSLGGVVFDTAGNLYGTTAEGGSDGDGIIFKMSPASSGGWTESVYLNFDGTNGVSPDFGLTINAGNIYGTTIGGGTQVAGTAFEIVP